MWWVNEPRNSWSASYKHDELSFCMIYLFYWCNWLIIEILFTFVLNLIWLYYIFIKIKILLKLGPRTGPFDPRGPRGGGGPIYLVCVRSGGGLAWSAANAGLCGWALRGVDQPAYPPLLKTSIETFNVTSIMLILIVTIS